MKLYAAVLALLLGSCVASSPASDPIPSFIVSVTNNNWNLATVYLIRNGARHRLGQLSTTQTQNYKAPVGTGQLQFEVRFLASGSWSSYEFFADPGARIELIIENAVQHSSVRIYENQ